MKLADFIGREDGAIAVIAGAAFAAAVGLAAFTVDLSNAYSVKGRLQNAADAAALAAAQKLAKSEDEARALALEFARRNVGPIDGTVTTEAGIAFGQYDPKAAAFSSGAKPYNAVKVTARRTAAAGNPVETYFGRIFGVETIDVQAEAVAVLIEPPACVYALDPSAPSAFAASGGGSVRVPNCGIQVNSKARNALTASGASSISAQTICVGGGYSGKNINPLPDPKCRLKPDPLASVPEPTPPADCHMTNVMINSDTILPADVKYCGKVHITSGANVTLQGGIVYFEDAHLVMDGSSSLEGEGVMLYFDQNSTFHLTSSNALRITAPQTGPWRGIAIFQSRLGSETRDSVITGDREVSIGGAIYAPRLDLEMTGNSGLYTNIESGYVITNTFKFNGSAEAVFDMRGGAAPSGLGATTALVR